MLNTMYVFGYGEKWRRMKIQSDPVGNDGVVGGVSIS